MSKQIAIKFGFAKDPELIHQIKKTVYGKTYSSLINMTRDIKKPNNMLINLTAYDGYRQKVLSDKDNKVKFKVVPARTQRTNELRSFKFNFIVLYVYDKDFAQYKVAHIYETKEPKEITKESGLTFEYRSEWFEL